MRTFTPDEARAVLPRLRPLLARLREAFHEHRFAREQAEELEAMHGEALRSPEHPDAAEAERWRARAAETGEHIERLLAQLHALGVEVKDPMLGLIDFYAVRATGETVYLCYRDDEETLAHWHPLQGGYAARRPLSEF